MNHSLLKSIPFSLLFILLLTDLHAQRNWQWGHRGGSGNPATNGCCMENAADVTTDRNGNIYVLGSANMGINVDGHTHAGYGNNLSSGNVILASWNCNGGFRWLKVIGSYTNSAGKSLRTDTLGGVYLTGYTISNNSLGYSHIDADSALGNTNKSFFIVKYDTAGRYQWLRMPQADTVSASSISYTGSVDMDAAPNGDLFVYSYLAPGLYSNSFTVNTDGIYVLRYNAAGAFQGATLLSMSTGGGPGGGGNLYNVQQSRFKRDHRNGRYYVSGHYDSGFGTLTMGSVNITAGAFMGCFNSNGTALWVKQSTSANPTYATAGMISGRPYIDAQSNVYITGNTFHGQTWNGHTFQNTLTTLEWPCPFVVKMDSIGNNIWTSNSSVVGAANGMAITGSGNELALTGNFYNSLVWNGITLQQGMNEGSDPFIARLNMQTGTVLGIDTLRSSYGAEELPAAITADRNGNYYLTGNFVSDLIVAGNTLNSIGGETDWYVAKYGAANCNCTLPVANYTNTNPAGGSVSFSYTGTTPVDSVTWDFGNGQKGRGLTTSKTYTQNGSYTVCATAYTTCGSNAYCKQVTISSLAVTAANAFPELQIFPNPAQSILHINGLREQASYTLYTGIGQSVKHGVLTAGQSAIDVSALAAGWYIVELQSAAGEKQRFKVVKQ